MSACVCMCAQMVVRGKELFWKAQSCTPLAGTGTEPFELNPGKDHGTSLGNSLEDSEQILMCQCTQDL